MSKGLRRSLKNARLRGNDTGAQSIPVDVNITVADGSPGSGTAVIRGLPKGNLLMQGAVAYLTFTYVSGAGMTADFAGDFAIGSNAVADGALSGTNEQNIIESTPMADGVKARATMSTTLVGAPVLLDNTDGSLELNLNILIDDGNIDGAAVVRAVGDLHVAMVTLGDDDDA